MSSKGDIVYYISYLGHKLERDDFAENKGTLTFLGGVGGRGLREEDRKKQ